MKAKKKKRVLLSRREAAEMFAKLTSLPAPDASTISRWCLQGVRGVMLACTKVGGRLYVDASDVKAFLKDLNTKEPAA